VTVLELASKLRVLPLFSCVFLASEIWAQDLPSPGTMAPVAELPETLLVPAKSNGAILS